MGDEPGSALRVMIERQDADGLDLTVIALLSAFGLTLALCSSMIICASAMARFQTAHAEGEMQVHGNRHTLRQRDVDSLPSVTVSEEDDLLVMRFPALVAKLKLKIGRRLFRRKHARFVLTTLILRRP